jgi:hypothetical protein
MPEGDVYTTSNNTTWSYRIISNVNQPSVPVQRIQNGTVDQQFFEYVKHMLRSLEAGAEIVDVRITTNISGEVEFIFKIREVQG